MCRALQGEQADPAAAGPHDRVVGDGLIPRVEVEVRRRRPADTRRERGDEAGDHRLRARDVDRGRRDLAGWAVDGELERAATPRRHDRRASGVEQAGRVGREEEPVGRTWRAHGTREVSGDVDDEVAAALAEHVERRVRPTAARSPARRGSGRAVSMLRLLAVGRRLAERERRPVSDAGLGCGEVDHDRDGVGRHAGGADIDALDRLRRRRRCRGRACRALGTPRRRSVTRRPAATAPRSPARTHPTRRRRHPSALCM